MKKGIEMMHNTRRVKIESGVKRVISLKDMNTNQLCSVLT